MTEYYDIDYNLGPNELDLLNRIIDCFASNIPVYAGPDKVTGLGKTVTGAPALFFQGGLLLFQGTFLNQIRFSDDSLTNDEFETAYYKEGTTGKYLPGLSFPKIETEADAQDAIKQLEEFVKRKTNNGQVK